MSDPRFLVIGDATLDVTVAPSRPLRGGGDIPALIRLGPGGQGANVAVRLARRGASVTLATGLADDAAGSMVGAALREERVRLAPQPVGRSAVVVALLDAGGERSMLSDRQPLAADGLREHVAEADWVHVSAYSLLDDGEADALASLLGARPEAVRLSIAGGSIPPEPGLVVRFRKRLAAARPDVVLASADEAAALLGAPARGLPDVAGRLSDLATLVVVTAGRHGSAAALEGVVTEREAAEVDGPVMDATGAGDAYLAAMVHILAAGDWPPPNGDLRRAMGTASEAGARVARVIGAQGRIAGEAGAART